MRAVWVSIRAGRLRFRWALPMAVLLMLADILEDFSHPAVWVLKQTPAAGKFRPEMIVDFCGVLKALILATAPTGPEGFLSVETGDVSLRCGVV